MNLITISRGSLSGATILAERLSEILNYPIVTREHVIEEAELQYNISETGMADMSFVDSPPSMMERQSYKIKHYLLSFQTILLEMALKGNMIYMGHFGHFILGGLPFVLRIRILRHESKRIQYLMDTEKISKDQAEIHLKLIDERRRKWAELLYGKNIEDAKHYDIVMNVENMSLETAADIVTAATKMPEFISSPDSEKLLQDLYLKAKTKLYLFLSPLTRGYELDIKASAEDGAVFIKMLDNDMTTDIEKFQTFSKNILAKVDDIKKISFV